MSQRQQRLKRKARRLLKSDVDRAFDSEMGSLRATRDDALREVNVYIRKETKDLLGRAAKARHDIWVEYDSQRSKLIFKHVDEQPPVVAPVVAIGEIG